MISVIWIIAAFVLVLMNALFVAAEFGMVKLRITRLEIIEEIHGIRGRILARIHSNLDAYLSACQLGITLASLGLGWIGEPAFSQLFKPFFSFIGLGSSRTIEFFSFFFAFAVISFLHIVVGELMPKSLAIRQSEKVSLWTAIPLYIFYWIMFPAIWLLNTCALYLLKLTKLHEVNQGDHFYATDEIKLILSASYLHGELTKDEAEILEHTLDFADLQVTDMMRPTEEMVALDLSKPIDQLLKIVMETRYSRYPILEGKEQHIIGIVHVKDLFRALFLQKNLTSLQPLIRPVLKVSERLAALNLLRQFREGAPHFAVIYRSDTPIGFITLDNLLHIIVGRIKDEFHKTTDDWQILPDGGFLFKGNIPIYTIERALNIEIETVQDESTLYGLILNKLDRLPNVGERIPFENFVVIVLAMQGPKLLQVKIYRE